MRERIKFRSIPPRSPHLNGKVERSLLTDLTEFWFFADMMVAEALRHISE
nr:hypothetical protein [Caballeronia terrestris]